jgi:hypothetical protein
MVTTYLRAVEELVLPEILPKDKPLFGVYPTRLHVIDSQHFLMVLQTPLCNIFIPLSHKEREFTNVFLVSFGLTSLKWHRWAKLHLYY